MLNVIYDPHRPHDDGQYYIELIDIDHQHPERSRRLGYWCDKAHLKTMAHAILEPFRYDVIEGLLGG